MAALPKEVEALLTAAVEETEGTLTFQMARAEARFKNLAECDLLQNELVFNFQVSRLRAQRDKDLATKSIRAQKAQLRAEQNLVNSSLDGSSRGFGSGLVGGLFGRGGKKEKAVATNVGDALKKESVDVTDAPKKVSVNVGDAQKLDEMQIQIQNLMEEIGKANQGIGTANQGIGMLIENLVPVRKATKASSNPFGDPLIDI